MLNNTGNIKYQQINGTQKEELTQLLVSTNNLSPKRAIKAINRYNGHVDFANAHSVCLLSILKGKAKLIPQYLPSTLDNSKGKNETNTTVYRFTFNSSKRKIKTDTTTDNFTLDNSRSNNYMLPGFIKNKFNISKDKPFLSKINKKEW